MGPLLFMIFMNDLPRCVENADIVMYADGTSAFSSIKSVSDGEYKLIPDMILRFVIG